MYGPITYTGVDVVGMGRAVEEVLFIIFVIVASFYINVLLVSSKNGAICAGNPSLLVVFLRGGGGIDNTGSRVLENLG